MKDDKHAPEKLLRIIGGGVISKSVAINAMENYASQETHTLKSKLEQARLDLADCKKEMDERLEDYNLTLEQARKENEELKSQIAELKEQVKHYSQEIAAETHRTNHVVELYRDVQKESDIIKRETWERACKAEKADLYSQWINGRWEFVSDMLQDAPLAEYQS